MTEYHQMWEPPAGPAELQRGAEDHEDATEKHSVAPGAVRPAQDLFGDLLMEMHQPKEALWANRQALSVAAGRRNALRGLLRPPRWLVCPANCWGYAGSLGWKGGFDRTVKPGRLGAGQVNLRRG